MFNSKVTNEKLLNLSIFTYINKLNNINKLLTNIAYRCSIQLKKMLNKNIIITNISKNESTKVYI